MRIKMKVTSASPSGVMQSGQVYTVADETGRPFVDGGYATEVPEQATAAPTDEWTPDEEPDADEAAHEPEAAVEEVPEQATAAPQRRNPARTQERKG